MAFEDETAVIKIHDLPKSEVGPEENRAAYLIVMSGSLTGQMYKLEQRDTFIGRAADATIRIEDDGVSRRHAQVRTKPDGSVLLRDLGSTNGTFCNGERIDKRRLEDNDKIQIGTGTVLKFSYQDALEEDFQRRQYESATRDVLTACFNKRYFLERLPAELSFAERHEKHLALAMMDIDFFKKVNDTYGHPAGDYVLETLAGLVRDKLRASDVVARFGGEEFALIMRETNADDGFVVAERIRRTIERSIFEFEGTVIPVTLSIGVAVYDPAAPLTMDQLITAADAQLYAAKNNGRNRTECEGV